MSAYVVDPRWSIDQVELELILVVKNQHLERDRYAERKGSAGTQVDRDSCDASLRIANDTYDERRAALLARLDELKGTKK